MISGPTGTGKTLAARLIHGNSPRSLGPFVTLHCGALPESLLETELFGDEKNASTSSAGGGLGHIERAAGGTLFLDEIGDVSPAVQAKVAARSGRKNFRAGRRARGPACGFAINHCDEQRIAKRCARDVSAKISLRLHVLEIEMPVVFRQRVEDIPALAAYFLGLHAAGGERELAESALAILQGHTWPGNIRELRNALEHAIAVAPGRMILPQHLPRELRERQLLIAVTRYQLRSLSAGAARRRSIAAMRR